MSKTYFFTYRTCEGAVGGGRGVVYKLYEANRKYHYIHDAYYIFKDMDFSDDDVVVTDFKTKKGSENKFISKLKERLSNNGICSLVKSMLIQHKAKKWIKNLNTRYGFCREDVYVFHDVESAEAFTSLYGYPNTIMVYHQQGSLYSEWMSFGGNKSNLYRKYLNYIFVKTCHSLEYIGFPSRGAEESLLKSEESLEDTLLKTKKVFLYNGFTPERVQYQYKNVPDNVYDRLKSHKGFNFITVAALNDAKGVERIPRYLGHIRDLYPDILWVIVGNGNKASEVEDEIGRNKLKNNVIWIKQGLSHDVLLSLFELTDFYILFHRFSIFDFATIEAMSFGNIPILTPVGGNKEVIEDGSGVFVEDFDDVSTFVKTISSKSLIDLKQQNINLQNSKFSEKAFLEGYRGMIASFNSETQQDECL